MKTACDSLTGLTCKMQGRRCNSSGQGSKDRLGSAPRESLELPRQDIGRQDSGFAPVQPPGDPPQRPNLRRPSSSNAAFRPSSRQQHPPSRNEQPSQSRNALRPSGAPSLGLVGRSLSFNSAQERPINRPLAPLESNGRPLVQPSFLPRIKTPQATTEPLAAPSESSRVPSFPDIHQKPAVARGRFVRDLKR